METKNKNTIILFNPLPGQGKGHRGVPLPLLAIAAPLAGEGYNIKIIDANVEDNCVRKVLDHIEDTLCVGITCMTGPQIKGALEVARAVKNKMAALPVVFGGWHATVLPDETIKNELIDIVVRGQGEYSFKEIVERLKENKPLDDIKGISYKRAGRIVSNEDRPLEDINNTHPMPYHILEDVEKYIYRDWYANRILSYISSFGCPHNCKFCAEHNMSRGRWDGLMPERVTKEINTLVEKYNLDGIALYDSNFFVNEERVRQICNGIIKKKIKWGNANGNANRLLRYLPQTWSAMEKSGCSEILIGAESGDDEILKFINKGIKSEDVVKLKKISQQYNIKLWVSMMVGIPFDLTNSKKAIKREFKACTQFVKMLYNLGHKDRFALFIYTPYPGTSLYEYSIKNGVKIPQKLENWSEFDLNTLNIPWINKKFLGLADFISNFIFVHSMPPEQRREDIKKEKLFKRLYLRICHAIVSYRISHNFYGLNFEFIFIKLVKFILAKLKLNFKTD